LEPRTKMTDKAITWTILGLGALLYMALSFDWLGASNTDSQTGTFVYNYYFLSLLEGRFDVPLRTILFEGHYDAEGHAYVYYGMAPLLLRALLYPFVDLKTVSLAPLSVWLFSAAGTAVYHLTFAKIIERFGTKEAQSRRLMTAFIGLAIWITSPGILLADNEAIFHEPIAFAYFTTACFLALFARVVLFGARPAEILIPLAILAGLTVHARPHVAIGLYAGVCLLILVHLRRQGMTAVGRVATALSILFVFGAAFLLLNELRFGSPFRFTGSAKSTAAVQYGFLYWGIESETSPRFLAYAAHGAFHPGRILPNLMLYAVDVPSSFLSSWIETQYRAMTRSLGFIAVNQPRIGFVFLWAPWILLIREGLSCRRIETDSGWIMLVATGIIALLMTSYGTVDLRYRFELWPFLAASIIVLLPRLLGPHFYARKLFLFLFVATLFLSGAITVKVLEDYHGYFGNPSIWSYEDCAELVKRKFDESAIPRLCSL
jgi:hypothetical protein